MVKHMDETEFDQIKTRIKDLAAMNAVDNAARIERVAIEEALLESPYKSHLYTEQMFDHLIFLELIEVNANLARLIAMLSPDAREGVCIGGSCNGHTSHAPPTNTEIEEAYRCDDDVPARKRGRTKSATRG